MQQILTIEFGGMAETLYNLAAATNNDRWAKAGDRFQKKSFLNPLAAHRDELRGLHVNTHIPQVIAAARRYEISGDMRFHDVADYFFYEVTTARTYVTGGTSNGEAWLAQPRQLAAELKLSVNTAECCCAYNMLKLTRHLYSWTATRLTSTTTSARCSTTASAPSVRKSGTRSITSRSLPAPGRRSTPRTRRSGAAPDRAWRSTPSSTTASTGTMRTVFYVNLFIPSELDWAEKGFKLRQETQLSRIAEHRAHRHRRAAGPAPDPPAHSGLAARRRPP